MRRKSRGKDKKGRSSRATPAGGGTDDAGDRRGGGPRGPRELEIAPGGDVAEPAFVNPLRGVPTRWWRASRARPSGRERRRAAPGTSVRGGQGRRRERRQHQRQDGGADGALRAPAGRHRRSARLHPASHATDFSEEAWAGGEALYAAQRGGGGGGKGGSQAAEEPESSPTAPGKRTGTQGSTGCCRPQQHATSDFASAQQGQLEAGEVLRVHEGLILPSGKTAERQGLVQLISNAGDTLVERTTARPSSRAISLCSATTPPPRKRTRSPQLRATAAVGAHGVSPEESEQEKGEDMHRGLLEILMVANVFSSVDVNRTGRIDLLGLSQLSQKLKIGLTVSQLKSVWGAICVDLEGSDAQKGAQRITFEQFFEGLLHLRQVIAGGDMASREIHTLATFRRGLLQRGSGPAAQVDVLLALLNQQRLDAARANRAIEERVAADAAAAAAAAQQAVEVLARQSRASSSFSSKSAGG